MYKVVLVFILVLSLCAGTLFSHWGRLLISTLENLASKVESFTPSEENCRPNIFYHRGYTVNYDEQATLESLGKAIEAHIKQIEVDVMFTEKAIYLKHHGVGPNHSWQDEINFQTFIENYAPHFSRIVIDIKDSFITTKKAVEQLKSFDLSPQKYVFIGRKCAILKNIPDVFPRGCEAYGIFANYMAGMNVWSVNYRSVTDFHLQMLKLFPLTPLLWVFPHDTDLSKYCGFRPLNVIIKRKKGPNVP